MGWSLAWTALGTAVLVLTAFDLLKTVLTVRGGGPVTGRANAWLWDAALGVHARLDNHRALAAVGPVLATLTLVSWLVGLWLGWTLVFCGAAEAVVAAKDQGPAGLVERVYFAGYTLTTLGLGDFNALGAGWRVATVLTAASGLMLFTMAITYIVPIVDATVTLRQLATHIDGLGDDPLDVVARSWDGHPDASGGTNGAPGTGFDPLRTHLTSLTPLVATVRQRYLAYPILHYFHSDDPRMSAPLRLAALDEAVTLLTHAVEPRVRLPRQVVAPLRAQLNGYLEMLEAQWIEPAAEPPPGYRLAELRAEGIPCVTDAELADALGERAMHRRRLAGLVASDGQAWATVVERRGHEDAADDDGGD